MSSKSKNRAASLRAGKGKCRLCQQQFSKGKIEEHLKKCLESKFPPPADDNKVKYFLLKAHADKVFWMYLKAPAAARLQDLDDLLRNIWVECCGHLSTFNRTKPKKKKGQTLTLEDLMHKPNTNDEKNEEGFGISKKSTLEKVLKPGDSLDYAYDMGTTTDIAIDVLSENFAPKSTDKAQNEAISILARNNHPMWECIDCDKTARNICSACFQFYCGKHGKRHGCDVDMLLAAANSPRCGFCGYMGNDEDEGDRLDLPEEDDADNGSEEEDGDDD